MLLDAPDTSQASARLNQLLGQLVGAARDSKASSRLQVVAVRGVGQLAAPAARLLGLAAVEELLQLLVPLVEEPQVGWRVGVGAVGVKGRALGL
jgi:hypothetical protein